MGIDHTEICSRSHLQAEPRKERPLELEMRRMMVESHDQEDAFELKCRSMRLEVSTPYPKLASSVRDPVTLVRQPERIWEFLKVSDQIATCYDLPN